MVKACSRRAREGQGNRKRKTSNTISDQRRDHPNVEELSTYIDVNTSEEMENLEMDNLENKAMPALEK